MSKANIMRITNARIITPEGESRRGEIIIKGRKIKSIRFKNCRGGDINAGGNFVSPGFIDLHIHGGPEKIAKREIKYGTTAFLWGLHTASFDEIISAAKKIPELNKQACGAKILGLYLEGPWVSPKMRGAIPRSSLRSINLKHAEELIKKTGDLIKVVVVAPELTNAPALIRYLRKRKIRVSIGHSDATYRQTKEAISLGITLATHTFNRMRALGHREPGAVGAVLEDERVYAEILLDGIHIHPAAFKLLLKTKGADRIILVTDSVASGPMPGSVRRGRIFQMKNGVFAGGTLTMNRAIKNAVSCGIGIADAVKMAALNPARFLGIAGRIGSIGPGKDADLVIFDKNFNVQTALLKGRICAG
ncbi:MAG: N-acetylglucosamine-6-phosphate deacetylase [Candidatus Omnitrophota bacterium]